MNVPVEITFRHMPEANDIKDWIMEKAAKLEEFCPHVSSCRVAIEKVQEHLDRGRPYSVRLDIKVPPGHELVIKKGQAEGDLHESLRNILDKTFDAAVRDVLKLAEKQKGKIKTHPYKEVNAFVEKIFKDRGYGFLKAIDGHEVYFHKNSVRSGDFNRLKEMTGVNYIEEQGEKGPQARAVRVVDPVVEL
jgi:cold shock CspA family protein